MQQSIPPSASYCEGCGRNTTWVVREAREVCYKCHASRPHKTDEPLISTPTTPPTSTSSSTSSTSPTSASLEKSEGYGEETGKIEEVEVVEEVEEIEAAFTSFKASDLWCATCGKTVGFRTLTQLDGTEAYLCNTCDTQVGQKQTTTPPARTATLPPQGDA